MTEKFKLYLGDSMKVLRELPESSIDSVVTDPPYHLTSIVKRFGSANAAPAQHGTDGAFARASRGFMGKEWDGGDIAFRAEFWAEVLRVLKPGGHRMACAIEDAGFEIRDSLQWVYGSGFPKSHNVSKGIDKSAGAERAKVRIPADDLKNPPNLVGGVGKGDDRPWRQEALERGYHEVDSDDPATEDAALWNGWGSALKPAHEPIALARKPLGGSIAANVLEHGTGALNIDGCRVGEDGGAKWKEQGDKGDAGQFGGGIKDGGIDFVPGLGRWPSNVLIDGSDEVTRLLPGDAASFFYCPKASKEDKEEGLSDFEEKESADYDKRPSGDFAKRLNRERPEVMRRNTHPTVKPVDLMRYLCRLITPPGGVILDPFMGSGSTGKAAMLEFFEFVGIDLTPEYYRIAEARIKAAAEAFKQDSLF